MEILQQSFSRLSQRQQRQTDAAESQESQAESQESGTTTQQSDEQEAGMAEPQQMTGNENQPGDMSQMISDAIRPVMEDLQQQITQTVQQQLGGGASAESNGAGALSLDSLGPIGDTIQSSMDTVVESLQPFFLWLIEKLQQLVSWIMGLFTGGESGEEEPAQETESQ